MAWSYRVATMGGIDLKVHATFALILFVAAANGSTFGATGMVFGIALVLLLFGCVILHEFGHAVAARHYGIPVREIVLLPIGGVAVLGRATRDPMQEVVIAAAGPAVNLAIMALLLPVLLLLGEPVDLTAAFLRPGEATPSMVEALRWLFGANVALVLFNLIPAFPLDGGRILRGGLGIVMTWSQATRWAATTGQVFAMGMGTMGLLGGQLLLVVIGVLIFFGASVAEADERAHTVLSTRRVGQAYNRQAITLGEADRVSTVIGHLLTSYQPDFAVMRGSTLLGVVQRSQVMRVLASGDGDVPVTAIMTACPTVPADCTLAETRQRLQDAQMSVAAVMDGSRMLGLVGVEDLAEAETILAALQTQPSNPLGPPRVPPAPASVEA